MQVSGDLEKPLHSPLSRRTTLRDAVSDMGSAELGSSPAARIFIGADGATEGIATWWNGWQAGVRVDEEVLAGNADNPLAGIAGGALAVGAAFQFLRGRNGRMADIGLWSGTEHVPHFNEVFLPSALWIIGLGNLGQSFLWSLGALPYTDASALSLLLQDYDHVGEENWGTSVLTPDDQFGDLKTRIAETWADERGFRVRRVDRRLFDDTRINDGDPRLAISGLDKIAPRKLLANVGFDAIIDVGLGRRADDYDRYRVSVFDQIRRIDAHFADMTDPPVKPEAPDTPAYHQLRSEIGRCGAAEVGNASVAAPYVSAVAGAIAIARAIAISSAQPCSPSDVQRLSALERRAAAAPRRFEARAIGHAGQPWPLKR